MVQCGCGKTLEKVPVWLVRVDVEFVCNNCPNRNYKNIASVTFESLGPAKAVVGAPEDLEVIEEEEA
jgi:hypothetical protein